MHVKRTPSARQLTRALRTLRTLRELRVCAWLVCRTRHRLSAPSDHLLPQSSCSASVLATNREECLLIERRLASRTARSRSARGPPRRRRRAAARTRSHRRRAVDRTCSRRSAAASPRTGRRPRRRPAACARAARARCRGRATTRSA
eukprot:2434267-Pleurochrysis_carterae.AAC.2